MITLYGSRDSSGFRCLWLLEELALPYEVKKLDMKAGEHKAPEYLALNPNGKVPTLVDGEFVLWESLAINEYLAKKAGATHLLGNSLEEQALIQQWSLWSVMHLYSAFYPLVMQVFRQTPDSDATKAALETEIPRYLKVLEQHLENKTYMVAERFTLADIAAMSVVGSAQFVKYDLSAYANIAKWMSLVTDRPAYKKLFA